MKSTLLWALLLILVIAVMFAIVTKAQTSAALQIRTGDSQSPVWLIHANGGNLYRVRMNASGGTQPYQWRASGLPLGLSVTDMVNGIISGTPTQSGNFTVNVSVTDANGTIVSRVYNLEVCEHVNKWGTAAKSCDGFGH